MRVRYPPEHYRSFYEWDQVPRTEKGWVKPLTLEAYVRITPDLQSGTLNHSYYALMAQYRKLPELVSGLVQPESLDRTAPDLVSRTLDEAECAHVAAVAAQVDVLYTTESEDAMWPVLRRLTGLALPVEHTHERPKAFSRNPRARHVVTLLDDPLEALTREAAPCDWRLYELAKASTKRVLAEHAA